MRDEALVHFHLRGEIAPGLHLRLQGAQVADLLSEAAGWLDRRSPGRCVAGFCALHAHLVENITPPPPAGWQYWHFADWDNWFGRLHGVFLVDMDNLRLRQYPLWSCGSAEVPCDFSRLRGRLAAVGGAVYG